MLIAIGHEVFGVRVALLHVCAVIGTMKKAKGCFQLRTYEDKGIIESKVKCIVNGSRVSSAQAKSDLNC